MEKGPWDLKRVINELGDTCVHSAVRAMVFFFLLFIYFEKKINKIKNKPGHGVFFLLFFYFVYLFRRYLY